MPFLLDAAAVLVTFVHPITSFVYAHGDELTCRLSATPSRLGIATEVTIEPQLLTLNIQSFGL
ncbi:hypothetical protein GCS56_000745 [Vibrio metschnikovii]|nr:MULTISPECIES: hypothetical protein [unclassified Vibrio]EKO3793379.1 hypothetical protein [Vibrio metschnikovii]EKO3923501.1 hypothetical protein [Vibrio metschnikovii]NAW62572.1 hypothetical protein [Vibrio sp. V31_P5A7T61]NAX01746.1 hypothetical protein [Vibrio sp. V34_P3A8T189]NAX62544.1 hypothetical protein [Vibrio sp. V32_P6A28T40]